MSEISPKVYSRKPFEVAALQVTEKNLSEVAEWCNGTIEHALRTVALEDGSKEKKKVAYIQVDVAYRARSERQKRAYVGDWVLESDTGFKVYTDTAFEKSFERRKDLKVSRDATDGRFVTAKHAEENPDTTVTEAVSVGGKGFVVKAPVALDEQ